MKMIDWGGVRHKPGSSRVRGETRPLLKPLSSQAAFTMIELLVVMAILGIVAVMAVPLYTKMLVNVRVSRVVSEIRAIEKSVFASAAENQSYPASLNAINLDSWQDPWGNPYEYVNIIDSGGAPRQDFFTFPLNKYFDIYSRGPDGLTTQIISDAEGLDDVVLARDGGWVGMGKDFN